MSNTNTAGFFKAPTANRGREVLLLAIIPVPQIMIKKGIKNNI